MPRPFLVAAVIAAMVSPALTAATASADSCMCVQASVGPMGMVSTSVRHPISREDVQELESAEVGPFFSSDGSMLTSEPASRARRAAQNTDVQWCVSADDPRCSPRDSAPGHGPNVADGPHVASGSHMTPQFDPPSPSEVFSRTAVDGERRGMHSRLDRPPRS